MEPPLTSVEPGSSLYGASILSDFHALHFPTNLVHPSDVLSLHIRLEGPHVEDGAPSTYLPLTAGGPRAGEETTAGTNSTVQPQRRCCQRCYRTFLSGRGFSGWVAAPEDTRGTEI